MEFTSLQRKLTFCLIVLVLAGLGFYIVDPAADGSSPSAGRPSPSPGLRSPSGVPSAASSRSPTSSAGGTEKFSSTPAAGQSVNIYQWLPFTPASLTSAAATVSRFADAYDTFSYAESGRQYLNSLRPLVSAQLGAQIEGAYLTPGVAAQRSKLKQVCTGSSSIRSLRAFGASSLTFIVTMTEHSTQAGGSNVQSAQYAVTVTGSGSSWQVTSLELASVGNS
jgi:hypothetical protein